MEQISMSTATELSNISICLFLIGFAVLIIGTIIAGSIDSEELFFITFIISFSIGIAALSYTKESTKIKNEIKLEEKIEKSIEEKIQNRIQEQDIFKSNIYD